MKSRGIIVGTKAARVSIISGFDMQQNISYAGCECVKVGTTSGGWIGHCLDQIGRAHQHLRTKEHKMTLSHAGIVLMPAC